MDIKGQVALITGAGRGIGRAIAAVLADAGATVVINYRVDQASAESLLAEITAKGGKGLIVQADVRRPDAVAGLVDVATHSGPLTILVNNAGIATSRPLDTITESDWDDVMEANLKSAFLVTQAALPHMRRAGIGRILMLSSIAAQTGSVIGPHYAASKAGMIGLAHTYAAQLVKENITCNAIAPALVETDMVTGTAGLSPSLIPLGRFGRVEEVADLALMLIRNGFITGQTININGGRYFSS